MFIERTLRIPEVLVEDQVALIAKSDVICGSTFTYECNCAGRTFRQLGTRLNEYVPAWLRNDKQAIAQSDTPKHLHETRNIVNIKQSI